MTLQSRDRRALAILGAAAILALAYRFWPESATSVVAPTGNSVVRTEQRLARLRESAATVEAKEAIFKKVSAELATREKQTLAADTLPQAQAQLMQIARRLGAAENPPVEIRATELGGIRPLGDDYSEANVSVQVECRIDQLINMLAALAAQPELVTLADLRVTSAGNKEKTVGVRMTLAGVLPRRLLPETNRPNASKSNSSNSAKQGGAF